MNPTINITDEDIITWTLLLLQRNHTTNIGPTLPKRVTRNANLSTDLSDVQSTSTPALPQASSLSPEISASLSNFIEFIIATQQVMIDELCMFNLGF